MASVIVRKSDNQVIDASDTDNVNYNSATHDNLHPPVNPIPASENPRKYFRDGGGNIIKRPLVDLVKEFEDEKTIAVAGFLTTIQADPALAQETKDAIVGLISVLAG